MYFVMDGAQLTDLLEDIEDKLNMVILILNQRELDGYDLGFLRQYVDSADKGINRLATAVECTKDRDGAYLH